MFATLFKTLEHLPVTDISESIAQHYATGSIPVVTSQVASGKTMILPAACATLLANDPVDPVVYVLEPTRFLANNAVESLRSILGKEHENLIGCINSNRSDDESVLHKDNRIIFTTVGYALSSGIIFDKSNFILDEAHETSIDLSLTKACLQHRREKGDQINVAILSATLDLENEMDYWGDDAVHFTTDGSAFPVEFMHCPAWPLDEAVQTLIQDHGRRGILVFVSGTEEIEDAIKNISHRLDRLELDYEIHGVHGGSTGEQRRLASRDRTRKIKILVGTNVLESGVSLPWVDSGVSSGDTKAMHVVGNMRKLAKEELPRWRITQQMGRTGRFCPGVFILAHPTPLEYRPEMAAPDIVRLPLTELVMHCTSFPSIHIHDLKFTKSEQPKPGAIDSAINTLVQYGLIKVWPDGRIVLTDEGKLIQPLPISYRAAAAYCEAHRLGKVAEMLPLIAMIDIGDMRLIHRHPMRGARWDQSDLVQQVMTVAQHFRGKNYLTYNETRELAEGINFSLKKYREYNLLLNDLERKTGVQASFSPYFEYGNNHNREAFDRLSKQVIFRAMILETYLFVGLRAVKLPKSTNDPLMHSTADLSKTSVCATYYGGNILFCSGNVRVVTPKRGFPFAVLESVTTFSKTDVKFLAKRFGNEPLLRIVEDSALGIRSLSALTDDDESEDDIIVDTKPKEPQPETVKPAPMTGSLGDILALALGMSAKA